MCFPSDLASFPLYIILRFEHEIGLIADSHTLSLSSVFDDRWLISKKIVIVISEAITNFERSWFLSLWSSHWVNWLWELVAFRSPLGLHVHYCASLWYSSLWERGNVINVASSFLYYIIMTFEGGLECEIGLLANYCNSSSVSQQFLVSMNSANHWGDHNLQQEAIFAVLAESKPTLLIDCGNRLLPEFWFKIRFRVC